jgi:ABC-type nitrate/sulfonate/bicarbonate transport system substrate-binding protein
MRATRTWLALLAVLTLLLAACGGSDEAGTGSEEGGGGTATEGGGDDAAAGGEGERSIIRFAFAPDPVWDYLNDTGELVKWEEEFNNRIVTSSTWDEFTYFAGGHGDIVSIGTQEIPVLEQETGIKAVTFGKYNFQRSPMMTRADTGYETLEDVPPGSNICVSSPVSNTQFWSVAMNVLHGIDYRVGGGDYELIVNDHFVNPENLLRGDCEAAVIIPEAAAPWLRTGELVLMYDGLMPFQLYNTFPGVEAEEPHVMSNLFSATEEYYDSHPEEIAEFLVLWQRGIGLWQENKAEIIATYPQHFSVEAEEDVQFIQDFMEGESDWFVDSVYLEQDWIEAEKQIYEFMVDLHPDNPNKLPEDYPDPRFEVVEPLEPVE